MNTKKQSLVVSSNSIYIGYDDDLKKFLNEIEDLKQKLISQGCDPDSIMVNASSSTCCGDEYCYCDNESRIYLSGTRLETDKEYEKRLKREEKYQKLITKIKLKNQAKISKKSNKTNQTK